MAGMTYTFTSESVCEGHPDKVCDFIADSILDAYIAQDRMSRVACEVLCKQNRVVLAGEISSTATVDHEAIVRAAIRDIGYTDPCKPFHAGVDAPPDSVGPPPEPTPCRGSQERRCAVAATRRQDTSFRSI